MAIPSKPSAAPPSGREKLQGLKPEAVAKFESAIARLEKEGIHIEITSAGRSDSHNAAVGGASHSHHTQSGGADAIDVSGKNLPPEKKARIVQVMAEEGCGGFGIYPNGGLHFDCRETFTLWGKGGSHSSHDISEAPAWAQAALLKAKELRDKGAPSSPSSTAVADASATKPPAAPDGGDDEDGPEGPRRRKRRRDEGDAPGSGPSLETTLMLVAAGVMLAVASANKSEQAPASPDGTPTLPPGVTGSGQTILPGLPVSPTPQHAGATAPPGGRTLS